MLRVVVDPGVVVSALLSPAGTPAQLIVAWLRGLYELIVSPRLLTELETVLVRPKLRTRIDKQTATALVSLLRDHAIVMLDPPAEPGLTPDPGDDYLITLARASRADIVVSGDTHLTRLKTMTPPVVTPKVCLQMLETR
ncbi:MAG: putative toxin-antitoxin system toxin component, PIN family [Armatimonadetes bacterium]|nr:putative toxin-antitoxin system toxin component, PIN family [Armatimonadota bacterium]